MATEKVLSVWGDTVHPRVKILGQGSPLVYLHGGYGPIDDELMDLLARHHTVYVPDHPGLTTGDEDAIKALDDFWDLVLYYYDLFDRLELKSPAVVGHSFGAMAAAEIAATDPARVSKLVLINALGLWRDAHPVKNYVITAQEKLPALMFRDRHHPTLKRILLNAEDQQGFIRITWSLGCTSKFFWPIPDKGLKKRLHRITAPTLILWGDRDQVVAPVYAEDFQKAISGATVEMIPGGAHMMTLEDPQMVADAVTKFLART